jgi:hypothetical protein
MIYFKIPVSPESAKVSISEIKISSITVTWLRPIDDGGSPVLDYKIQINTQPPREINTKDNRRVILDLKGNTTYILKVYARNVVGYGKVSVVEFTTKMKGECAKIVFHLCEYRL